MDINRFRIEQRDRSFERGARPAVGENVSIKVFDIKNGTMLSQYSVKNIPGKRINYEPYKKMALDLYGPSVYLEVTGSSFMDRLFI